MKKRLLLVIGLILALVLSPSLSYAGEGQGDLNSIDGFKQISENGFGDLGNSYALSMAYFKGDLYVGTARNLICNLSDIVEVLGSSIFGLNQSPWDRATGKGWLLMGLVTRRT